eukprot:COSAG04_NODE_1344_length_7145_cov_59.296764_5_plen_201_part_00
MVSTKPCGNHFKSRALLARPAVARRNVKRESSSERSHSASARALIRIVRQPADSRRLRSSASPRALASLGGSFCAPAMLTRGAFRASRRARLSAQTTFVRNLNNITVRFFRDARRSGQRPGPFGLEERAEPGWWGGGGGGPCRGITTFTACFAVAGWGMQGERRRGNSRRPRAVRAPRRSACAKSALTVGAWCAGTTSRP